MPTAVRSLLERRVPHTLAIYAGASWALIEFVAFAVDEFLLSPHLTRVLLAGLLLLLPTVCMLAWFHGRPGRERDRMPRTEKIGIPANMLLAVIVLWMLFGDKDLGAATTTLTMETDDGEELTYTVLKPEFRRRTALFPLEPGPGLDEDWTWTTYAVPLAVQYDLTTDDFFLPMPPRDLAWGLRRHGYDDLRGAPLSLKREIARERFAEYVAVGEIDRVDGRFRVTLAVHEAKNGRVAGQTVHEGDDLLALVDEMSVAVRAALGIDGREGVEDLPARHLLTEDPAALEEFVRGMHAVDVNWDAERGIEHFAAATALDPTFTTAYRELSRWLMRRDRADEALEAIQAAMANLHRLPERGRFQVRTEYYLVAGAPDRAAAILEMWLELYPEDLNALEAKWRMQDLQGDMEGSLATLEEMRRLNPGNGGLLLLLAEYQEGLGMYEDAAAALGEYLDRFPDDAGGALHWAGFQRRRGEPEAARDVLTRAVLLHPLSAGLAGELAALDMVVGRFDDARRGFERTLDQARTPAARARALQMLQSYHRFRGELEAAIRTVNAWFDELSGEGLPEPAGLRVEDVELYLDAGRVGEAAALLEKLAALGGVDADYVAQRIEVRVALESAGADAALEVHERVAAQAVAAEQEQLRRALDSDLGLIQQRAGDYAAAAASYRAALGDPDDSWRWGVSPGRLADYRVGAGRALRMAGRLDESETELRQALRYIPAHPHAHLELALLLAERQDSAGAVAHLESALAAWENADESFAPAVLARRTLAELSAGR